MEPIIQQMKSLGFNEYQAKAYVSLVKQGTTTAYQVSKGSEIPRSRIYDVLDVLVQRGIVIKQSINNTIRYSPISVDVFLSSIQSDWNDTFRQLSSSLKTLEERETSPEMKVLTLQDKNTIYAYCSSLIEKAQERIVVSLWQDMYLDFEKELEHKMTNCRLHGIAFDVENPLSSLDVHRNTSYTENIGNHKWFILSIDGKEMIYGPSIYQRDTAFYTDDPIHIYLLENYVWHDILVNRIVQRTDEDMDTWISIERDDFFHQS